jgi:hypothetical protein
MCGATKSNEAVTEVSLQEQDGGRERGGEPLSAASRIA